VDGTVAISLGDGGKLSSGAEIEVTGVAQHPDGVHHPEDEIEPVLERRGVARRVRRSVSEFV
jgi:hypothetical protein